MTTTAAQYLHLLLTPREADQGGKSIKPGGRGLPLAFSDVSYGVKSVDSLGVVASGSRLDFCLFIFLLEAWGSEAWGSRLVFCLFRFEA